MTTLRLYFKARERRRARKRDTQLEFFMLFCYRIIRRIIYVYVMRSLLPSMSYLNLIHSTHNVDWSKKQKSNVGIDPPKIKI